MKINLTKMDSEIALVEGKKKQTSVGNVREVRKLVIWWLRNQVKQGNVSGIAALLGMGRYLK